MRFWGNREEWVFPLNHFILSHFKVPNKGIDFPFPPLKLQNKGRDEYSKIILFISFHSIPSPPSIQGLKLNFKFLDLSFSPKKKKKISKEWSSSLSSSSLCLWIFILVKVLYALQCKLEQNSLFFLLKKEKNSFLVVEVGNYRIIKFQWSFNETFNWS